jgi:hypothetical protein
MNPTLILGGLATVGVIGVAALLLRDDDEPANQLPTPTPAPAPTSEPAPTPAPTPNAPAPSDTIAALPTAADVPGFDLVRNWGKTPTNLRPLFALMERLSGIDGAGRIFATIAKRESAFVATALNDSEAERKASRRAYDNMKDRNPALAYGMQAAEFGSGGLFGALAPYFLWTGVPEEGDAAPLLQSPPNVMFLPRVAGFAACVYLQRLVAHYRLDDHLDIKAGWASPSLLKADRGSKTYQAVRDRFNSDAIELGVDLEDITTIPKTLSAARWPGVPKLFADLVGQLPPPRTKG